jgi:hypothetical protein
MAGEGAGAMSSSRDDVIPGLRPGLDFMPSPIEHSPGLILRDALRYSEEILLIPPVWIPALAFLDGTGTELDIQAYLTRASGGSLVPREDVRRFVRALRDHGFLDSEEFHQRRETRHEEFRLAALREPVHAGIAYPSDARELSRQLRDDFRIVPATDGKLSNGILGVAAPHVSPFGGLESYGAAYRRLAPDLAGKTFVILGTSHYGEPEKFGLTRKPYRTPLGLAKVDGSLVDRLERNAPQVVIQEDYCHAIEHSIEFQVVFLQQVVGASVRILPILCGPLIEGFRAGLQPDSHKGVAAFVEALAEIAASEGDRLFWVLGVDMAHIGARYGDRIAVRAREGRMREVSDLDNARIDRICAADVEGFVRLVQTNQDELKWCGYSPIYVFLRAMSQARPQIQGRMLHYDQWNIDAQSVVSFAALEFFEGGVR